MSKLILKYSLEECRANFEQFNRQCFERLKNLEYAVENNER